MSETEQAAEAVEEQEATAAEEPAAEVAPEAEAEAQPEPEAQTDEPEPEPQSEPEADAQPEPEPEPEAQPEAEPDAEAQPAPAPEPDPEVVAAEEELAEEAIPVPVGPAAGRQAKVFLCDRGHRTVAVWSEPTTCHARPTRSGGDCGRQLYPIGELPEQVQKALNPLKASKKASKG